MATCWPNACSTWDSAYENVSYFGDNGFPDLADRILRAAAAGPRPAFEAPYRWRKKHQKRAAAGGP